MKLYSTLLILIILTGCSSSDSGQKSSTKTSDTLANVSPDNYSLDEQPTKTIIDFLKWYKDHQDVRGCLVLNSCNGYDSTKFYSVDFNATEKYLADLLNTGFISKGYADKWRKYFENCDKELKANPANDGPPYGFEYDFIMLSQDTEEDLNNLNKGKVISLINSADHATVKIAFQYGHQLVYKLTKLQDKWVIDDIDRWEEK